MSHPYQRHREHHVERERAKHIAGVHEGHRDYEHVYHRARGGKVEHKDEAEDKAIVKSMVKGEALKHGHKGPHRADKRARGGKVKHKGKTVVNVNVAPQQSAPHPAMPMPAPAGAAPPMPPPRPPMPAAPPPGGPPMMGPRARGGRTGYAGGGTVAGGMNLGMPSTSGISAPAPVSNPGMAAPVSSPGMSAPVSNPGMNFGAASPYHGPMMMPRKRGGAVRATGGPVEPHFKAGVGMGPKGNGMPRGKPVKMGKEAIYSPSTGAMGPTSGTGEGGGVARKEFSKRAAKYYAKTPPAIHTPGMRND